MCEFCTRHGEGKKWYENIANYTEEVFRSVNSEGNLRKFLSNFRHSLRDDVVRAHELKRRLPLIYSLIISPWITRKLKKTHFGQVVPLEAAEAILSRAVSIVRLPCICRKVTTGQDKRFCFGIGLDLTPVFQDIPDFSAFERWTAGQAIDFIRDLDREGKIHSVWTFNTPFIGALCNCDRDCMAYRFQENLGLGKTMWKAEYAAAIDPLVCTGCKKCMERCYFEAVIFDRQQKKCRINQARCFGCGICRPACQHDAVTLLPREQVPEAAASW
jgi:ferredoxin